MVLLVPSRLDEPEVCLPACCIVGDRTLTTGLVSHRDVVRQLITGVRGIEEVFVLSCRSFQPLTMVILPERIGLSVPNNKVVHGSFRSSATVGDTMSAHDDLTRLISPRLSDPTAVT